MTKSRSFSILLWGAGLPAFFVSIMLSLVLLLEGTAFPALAEEKAAGSVPDGVKKLLSRLESASNRNNISDILECYEPSMTKAATAISKLLGVDNAGDIMDALPLISLFMSAASGQPSTYQITPLSYEGDDYYGNVKYHVVCTYRDRDTTEAFDQTASVKKVDNTWYIAAQQSVNVNIPKQSVDPVIPEDVTTEDFEKGISYVISHRDSYTPSSSLTKYEFVNPDGKVLFYASYQDVAAYTSQYAWVKRDNKYGVVNCAGQLLLNYTAYNKVEKLYGEYWKIYGNYGRGMINLEKGESLPCIYSEIGIPNEGYVPVKKDGYWGVVDVTGNTVVDFIYSDMNDTVQNGRIGAAINGSWGIVAMDGTRVIPQNPKWRGVKLFPSGVYALRTISDNEIWIFYNAEGEEQFQQKYSRDLKFPLLKNGYFLVDGQKIISPDGKIAADFSEIAKTVCNDYKSYTVNSSDYDGKYLLMSVTSKEGNYYNLIDLQGKPRYETWFTAGKRKTECPQNGLYAFINGDNSLYILYHDKLYKFLANSDTPENLVPGSEFFPTFSVLGDHMIVYEADLGKTNHSWIFDSEEEKAYPFYKIDIYVYGSSHDHLRSNVCEVSDGIFVGLATQKGLLGNGVSYTKTKTAYTERTAELEYGSEKLSISIGSDGTAYELIDGKNVAVDIQPLTGGIPITGTKLPLRNQATPAPTVAPTPVPTAAPTEVPTSAPTAAPTAQPTTAPLPTEQPILEDGGVFLVCGEEESVTLYQGPSAQYSALAAFPIGTPVQVVMDDGSWAYVIIGTSNGFLESRFLSSYDPAPTAAPAPTLPPLTPAPIPPVPTAALLPTVQPAAQQALGAGAYPREAVTSMRKVNVRSETNTESRLVRQLADPGTGVTVLWEVRSAEDVLWYIVRLSTGELGYIRGNLLIFSDGGDTQ